jgi:hypothetical protein
MAKAKDIHDPASVDAHIRKLDASMAEMVEAIRRIILDTDVVIGEQIKWNSPSFFYTGPMAPFDPKEYRRDIAVLNIHRGYPLLVLPTGTTINDNTGILEGKYTDGRRMVSFKDLPDVQSKAQNLQIVIGDWLNQVK